MLFLFQISLWGNKCDLSLSGGEHISQKTNIMNSLEDLKPFILVNDMDRLWSLLSNCKKTREKESVTRVDIVLDINMLHVYGSSRKLHKYIF